MPMHGEDADDFRFKTEEQIEADEKAAREAEEAAALVEAKRQHEQQQEAEEEQEPEDALQELADNYPTAAPSLPGVE